MATQNIIQYLETSQYNALPAGGTVPVGVEAMNRRQIETFIASEAIAVREAVAFDITKAGNGDKMIHVVKADSNDVEHTAFVGVALGAAEIGETVDVCIAGLCEAKTDGSVTKGSALSVFTTAGELKNYANSDVLPPVAYACEDDGTAPLPADVATIIVIKQF